MWDSSQQCRICYKIRSDLDEKVSRENETDDYRRQLLSLCSEYLFSELCDWKSISDKETLPFCDECYAVILKIQSLDAEHKSHELDISNFCELFAVKVLRLRNKQNVDIFPKVVGGVTIKIEKGVEQEVMCKICHGIYNERRSDELLNLTTVTKVVTICKKYLFSEIFDEGSLDLDVIVRNNLLPFCFDCCIIIQDICQKSDMIQNISAESEMLVNGFAVKVLKYRKTRNYSDDCAAVPIFTPENSFQIPESPTPALNESIIKVLPQTAECTEKVFQAPATEDPILEVPLQNQVTSFQEPPAPTVDETASDDDECMIVDVIPAGVERNILNSLCNKLKINKDGVPTQDSPGEPKLPKLWEAFPCRKTTVLSTFCGNERQNLLLGVQQQIRIPSGVVGNIPVIEQTVQKHARNSSESGNRKLDEGPPILTAEIPSPNRRTSNRSKPEGNFKCQNCGAVFLHNYNWLRHIDSCFEGNNLFECETCNLRFSDPLLFSKHIESHNTVETGNPKTWKIIKRQKRGAILAGRNRRINAIRKPVKPYKYKCPHCNRSFSGANHLTNHLKSRKYCKAENFRPNQRPMPLSLKRGQASKKNSIKQILKSNKGSFKCSMCPMEFNEQMIFSKHLQTHYDIASPLNRCDICRKVFSCSGNRNVHFTRLHPEKITRVSANGNYYDLPEGNVPDNGENLQYNPNPVRYKRKYTFTCSACQKIFKRKNQLRLHYHMHHTTPEENQVHPETHEENQTYDEAPEENIDEDNDDKDPEYSPKRKKGEVEISTRTTMKYCCYICRRRFRGIMILRNHLQSHYDEAPYKCTICRKVLTNQRTLDRHMDTVHAGQYTL